MRMVFGDGTKRRWGVAMEVARCGGPAAGRGLVWPVLGPLLGPALGRMLGPVVATLVGLMMAGLVAVGLVAVGPAGAAVGQTVNIGTGPKATLTNNVGIALASVLGGGAQIKGEVVAQKTTTQDQPDVIGDQLPFAIYSTQQMDIAVKGIAEFKGHPQPNLRVAARLMPITVAILVRKKSKIKTVADLKGKRFPSGYTAQQSLTTIVGALLANGEMTVADIKKTRVESGADALADFLAGKLDATVWMSGDTSLKTIDGKVGGIRIIEMSNSGAAEARMESYFANADLFQLQPSKDAIGYSEPTWVMTYDLALVTSAKTDDEIVYRTVKAIHGAQAALEKSYIVFDGFNPAKMAVLYPGQLYHPGAIKFYKEIGIWLGN